MFGGTRGGSEVTLGGRINKSAKASVKDLHQVEPQSDRYQRPEENFITRYITAVAGEAKEREHRRATSLRIRRTRLLHHKASRAFRTGQCSSSTQRSSSSDSVSAQQPGSPRQQEQQQQEQR